MPNTAQPPLLASMFPFILIFAVFYFLLIRPQKKRQLDHEVMLKNLKKGDQVVTSGGINGIIVHVKESSVILKVNDNTTLDVQKSSISVVKKEKKE